MENIRFEAIQQHHLLQVRNDQTRTCLDLAAMLGHHETVKILAEKGATMMTDSTNLTNGLGKKKKPSRDFSFHLPNIFSSGYSCLHLACAWNQLESVKNLIAAGGDIEMKTINGEKAIDIAKRYHYDELVQYLEWIGKIFRRIFSRLFLFFFIAIRNRLTHLINHAKDFLADPTKSTNKMNKDDKVRSMTSINRISSFVLEKNGEIYQ